ncbi:4-hydroxy-tetrahydrodipicolinate synthase [Paenibacillus sp. RC67]|uniref:4-hydroxy-tetrahydrodipicolinate synthase n=1 Tax=Paenibacillus sp. RC67 TaxID=3039392 RepID=UPI0024AD0D8E|nr:4-hydroxy-tetrahydrodipicolinate synthase [Paenibacillus sp. RC67]
MFQPNGIIPAMITPFHSNQELNESALRLLVSKLLAAGAHGLFCLGTNGEFFSMTFEEKIRVAEVIVDEVKGRVPVYVGIGHISTVETVQLARRMEDIGADTLSVITPFFLKFTQKELFEHFRRIAESTSLPILLYNIPARTGNHLQPETVAELAAVDNIVGIKDSSGSFDTILQYIELSGPDFSVLAGTDSLILPTLMAGGQGAIAATANVFPEAVVSIYENWKKGNYDQAESSQRVLRDLRNAFQLSTLPSVLKEALNILGFPAGPPRLPVNPLSGKERSELIYVMENYLSKGLLRAEC